LIFWLLFDQAKSSNNYNKRARIRMKMRINMVARHGYWGPLRGKREKIPPSHVSASAETYPHRWLLNASGEKQT
jgi:hypothetical protein